MVLTIMYTTNELTEGGSRRDWILQQTLSTNKNSTNLVVLDLIVSEMFIQTDMIIPTRVLKPRANICTFWGVEDASAYSITFYQILCTYKEHSQTDRSVPSWLRQSSDPYCCPLSCPLHPV